MNHRSPAAVRQKRYWRFGAIFLAAALGQPGTCPAQNSFSREAVFSTVGEKNDAKKDSKADGKKDGKKDEYKTIPNVLPPEASDSAPLTLDQLIELGLRNQPALSAAQFSLDAARQGGQALERLPLLVKPFIRDLNQRRAQSCEGVSIAEAALEQAQWETRYAVTRNYYSVLYARMQNDLVREVHKRLQDVRKKVKAKVDDADPDTKVTNSDVEYLDLNIELFQTKTIQAEIGERKAAAALREALGLNPDQRIRIASGPLPDLVPDLDLKSLIQQGMSLRPEIRQASSAKRVTELEVEAQFRKFFSLKTFTFGAASDIHAKPIPQGVSNTDYRPGAIGLEMPNMLVGRRCDRVERARSFDGRAGAVLEKAGNLVALEIEALYLKYRDGLENARSLEPLVKQAEAFLKKTEDRLQIGETGAGNYIGALGLREQARASRNEAFYMHALGLAGLERATAGAFRLTAPNPAVTPGVVMPEIPPPAKSH